MKQKTKNNLFHNQRESTAAAAAAKSLQSCLTLRPCGRQPTRLPHPWDSPGWSGLPFPSPEKALSLHKDLKWKSLDAAEVASFINSATND